MVAEVSRGGVAVLQVIQVERFVEPDGDGFEVATGQPAVGREALGEDEQVAFGFGQFVVVGAQEPADVPR